MPLIKQSLKAELEAIFSQENTAAEAADKLATAIDNYIKTATVFVNPGIPVAAPPPSGIGATTGPGSGSLQ